ncbi:MULTISPECIES: hypothetical protein [unclassified Mesorhizobium]|uniref:hypothetical protein n=1 Tax=unclassified Mesorhizobium TaxID=325217 RepID=UPI00165159C9|nr:MULTISPECIES: hypothetical protein [unclassified Mesorhizobium]
MDEDNPHRDAYRLQRIVDGNAITIATFYSAKEALNVIPSLKQGYRLTLGDRQIWPSEAPSSRHDDIANYQPPNECPSVRCCPKTSLPAEDFLF